MGVCHVFVACVVVCVGVVLFFAVVRDGEYRWCM